MSAEKRNNIEKLTLAALSHLPTAVLYVHDLTGECGTTVVDQVKLRLLEYFPTHEKWPVMRMLMVPVLCPVAYIQGDKKPVFRPALVGCGIQG